MVLEATVWTTVTARTTVAKTERPVIGGQGHHSGEMMITGEIGMSHLAITAAAAVEVALIGMSAETEEMAMVQGMVATNDVTIMIAMEDEEVALIATNDEITMIEVN